MREEKKIIGIIGGMGPEAGVIFQSRINAAARKIKGTTKDKDYPSIIHLSFPERIPDRTEYLLGLVEENPAYPVAAMANELAAVVSKRDKRILLAIPCNTFHAKPIWDVFLEEVIYTPNLEILHLVNQTVEDISKNVKKGSKIAVLGTLGTNKEKIYEARLSPLGYEIQTLSPQQQKDIHKAIYDNDFGLKALSRLSDSSCHLIESVVKSLEEQGVERIILGSTELSLAYDNKAKDLFIDPLNLLAERLVYMSTE